MFRMYLAVMGVQSLQPFQKNQPMLVIIKRLLAFLSLIIFIIFAFIFLGYEARTLNEYADSFYWFAAKTMVFCVSAIILWKMNNLFKLFGAFEKTIEQSKLGFSKLLYKFLNILLDKRWNKNRQIFCVSPDVYVFL